MKVSSIAKCALLGGTATMPLLVMAEPIPEDLLQMMRSLEQARRNENLTARAPSQVNVFDWATRAIQFASAVYHVPNIDDSAMGDRIHTEGLKDPDRIPFKEIADDEGVRIWAFKSDDVASKFEHIIEKAKDKLKDVWDKLFHHGSRRDMTGQLERRMGGINADIHGVVAIDESKKAIWIAMRGTSGFRNIAMDLLGVKSASDDWSTGPGKIHEGFRKSWVSVEKPITTLLQQVLDGVDNGNDYNIFCTGHSLGAAVAELCYSYFHNIKKFETRNVDVSSLKDRLHVINFASPRVGDVKFTDAVNKLPGVRGNFGRPDDIITKVPLYQAGFVHMIPRYQPKDVTDWDGEGAFKKLELTNDKDGADKPLDVKDIDMDKHRQYFWGPDIKKGPGKGGHFVSLKAAEEGDKKKRAGGDLSPDDKKKLSDAMYHDQGEELSDDDKKKLHDAMVEDKRYMDSHPN